MHGVSTSGVETKREPCLLLHLIPSLQGLLATTAFPPRRLLAKHLADSPLREDANGEYSFTFQFALDSSLIVWLEDRVRKRHRSTEKQKTRDAAAEAGRAETKRDNKE